MLDYSNNMKIIDNSEHRMIKILVHSDVKEVEYISNLYNKFVLLGTKEGYLYFISIEKRIGKDRNCILIPFRFNNLNLLVNSAVLKTSQNIMYFCD